MQIWKALVIGIAAAAVVAACPAVSGERSRSSGPAPRPAEIRLRLVFEAKEAVVLLYDDPAARDLLSQLPLTLPVRDYIGKEKIAYLPRRLPADGSSPESEGDFAYYAPWGNLALFYRGEARAGEGLSILGRIEKGKSSLAEMEDDFTMDIMQFD